VFHDCESAAGEMGASIDGVNACDVMPADGRQVDAAQCITNYSENPDLIWVNDQRSQLNHNASAAANHSKITIAAMPEGP
jgi:hypothetical protein